jgi:hypothetical protein
MADGRQRAEWQRSAILAAYIADSVSLRKSPTDLNKLLPQRYRIIEEVTPESQRMAFDLLGFALRQITKKKASL